MGPSSIFQALFETHCGLGWRARAILSCVTSSPDLPAQAFCNSSIRACTAAGDCGSQARAGRERAMQIRSARVRTGMRGYYQPSAQHVAPEVLGAAARPGGTHRRAVEADRDAAHAGEGEGAARAALRGDD